MPRIAFHLRIKDGKRQEYREEHENVPNELEEAYLESGAGLETYSVFEKDGHVFGYMEVEDPEVIYEVMEESEAQAEWADVMEPILEDCGVARRRPPPGQAGRPAVSHRSEQQLGLVRPTAGARAGERHVWRRNHR